MAEPAASASWCTVAQVAEVTGKTVTDTVRNLAAQAIELNTGLIESVARVDMTRRDAYWLRQAVAYQAAWLAPTPDYLERNDVSSASQDGQSAQGANEDWLILAPLARRALKRLSWRGTRTIDPRPSAAGRTRVPSVYVPLDADDEAERWRPL